MSDHDGLLHFTPGNELAAARLQAQIDALRAERDVLAARLYEAERLLLDADYDGMPSPDGMSHAEWIARYGRFLKTINAPAVAEREIPEPSGEGSGPGSGGGARIPRPCGCATWTDGMGNTGVRYCYQHWQAASASAQRPEET